MIYILLLSLSFILTYLIKNYYIKNAILEEINERSSHTIPTPHGGGIAISITWFIGITYLYFTNGIDVNLFYALMMGSFISIVSYFDDLYDLSPKLRIIVQSAVALLGIYFLGGLQNLDFGLFVIENQIITNIFAFLLIVWFINLYNFLDGINGYAGSEALFLGMAGFILYEDNYFLIFAVSTLGFLFWNFGNNAKIFMGDVGSTLLGYNIAIFTLYNTNQESTNLWIWIILFSLFWFDATITLIRRKLYKEKLSIAHKNHAYQRLNQSSWSHLKVTSWSIIINIILFSIVYFISNIFVSLLLTLIILSMIYIFIEKKKKFDKKANNT